MQPSKKQQRKFCVKLVYSEFMIVCCHVMNRLHTYFIYLAHGISATNCETANPDFFPQNVLFVLIWWKMIFFFNLKLSD